MRKTLPPVQLDHAAKTQVIGQIAHTPGHDAKLGVRQTTQRGLVEMIEMRMCQEDDINRREMLDTQAGAFDALEQEQPIGKIRVNQHVQIRELHQERGVPDPSQGHLAPFQLGEHRPAMLPNAPRQERFPNHFVEKRPRVEMPGGR